MARRNHVIDAKRYPIRRDPPSESELEAQLPGGGMKMPMPWFIPLGAGLGFAGTRTAWLMRKARGGGNRTETWMLVLMAWLPLFIWTVVAITEIAD